MGAAVKTWSRAINDILHDLAAGVWPGAVFALWMVRRTATSALGSQAMSSALARSWTWILAVMLAALVVQVATGGARLFYWKAPVDPSQVRKKGRVAGAKHAVFVLIFVIAAVEAFALLGS
jgi:putative copper export protein